MDLYIYLSTTISIYFAYDYLFKSHNAIQKLFNIKIKTTKYIPS